MKTHSLLLALSAGLSGCSFSPMRGGELAAHPVSVNGESYVLKQITESTWTASTAGRRAVLPATSASTAALQRAVEKTSGCKVTDSDYSSEGKQFDAQVDCGSSLAN